MFLIQQITSNPYQKQTLVLDDGSTVAITLYFRPQQQGWFIDELVRGDFVLRGVRVCNSPNLLHQYRNKIPFGLGCFSTGNREPSLIEDFSSENSKLYILSGAEVLEFEEYLQNG